MDDIVAVKVRDSKVGVRYFITWGRIFDRVDPKSLESVIAKHVSNYGIANLKAVTVCDSLQEASRARYFHEALFHISQQRIPYGTRTYAAWRAKTRKLMMSGKQLFYCGNPKRSA